MTRQMSRILDDHYWTARLIGTGAVAFVLSVLLGGVR